MAVLKSQLNEESDKTKDEISNGDVSNEGSENSGENLQAVIDQLKAQLEEEKRIKAEAISSRDKAKSKLREIETKQPAKRAENPSDNDIPDYVKRIESLVYRQDKMSNEDLFNETYNKLPDSFKKMVDSNTSDEMLFGEKLKIAKEFKKALDESGIVHKNDPKPTAGLPGTGTNPSEGSKVILDEFEKSIKEVSPELTDEQVKKRAVILRKKKEELKK